MACNFCCRMKQRLDIEYDDLAPDTSVPRRWTNPNGQEVSARRTVVASQRELQLIYKLDSITRAFNTKNSQLLAYISTTIEGKARVEPVSKPVVTFRFKDSAEQCPPPVAYMEQEYESPYYKIKARTGDSAYVDVQTFDTLSLVQTKAFTRSGFLGLKRNYFIDTRVISANPDEHVYVKAAARISDRPDPSIVIGPSVGYGWYSAGQTQPVKSSWFIGFTATKPIIKIRSKR